MKQNKTTDAFHRLYHSYFKKMNAHFAQSMETSLAWYEKLLPTADENLEKARPFLERRNSDYVPAEIMQLVNDANATIFSGRSTATANFIYLFALFEQFLINSVALFAASKTKRGEVYYQFFRDIADKRNKEGDDRLIKAGNFGQKRQLEFLNDMPLFDIAENMFGFDKKRQQKIFSEFTFFRETRNLLLHRGDEIDKEFIRRISVKTKMQGKKLETFLRSHLNFATDKALIGTSAHSNLLHLFKAYECLFKLGSLYLINTSPLEKNNIDRDVLPFGMTHDMMLLHLKFRHFPITLAIEPILDFLFERANGDWGYISKLDKANVVIVARSYDRKRVKDGKETMFNDNLLESLISTIDDSSLRELLEHIVDKGANGLRDAIKKYALGTNTSLETTNNWFLTKAHNISF